MGRTHKTERPAGLNSNWPFPPPPSDHLPDAGKMIDPASEATPQGRPAAAPDGAPDGPEGPEDRKG